MVFLIQCWQVGLHTFLYLHAEYPRTINTQVQAGNADLTPFLQALEASVQLQQTPETLLLLPLYQDHFNLVLYSLCELDSTSHPRGCLVGDIIRRGYTGIVTGPPRLRWCCFAVDSFLVGFSGGQLFSLFPWNVVAWTVTKKNATGVNIKTHVWQLTNPGCPSSLCGCRSTILVWFWIFSRALLLARSDSTSHSAMSICPWQEPPRPPYPWIKTP